jgi:hypothetical protein
MARLLLVHAATLLGNVMSLIPPVASSRCKCGRATSHIHYSSSHGFFVKYGLVLLVFAEVLSFIQRFEQGFVKGSTTLFPIATSLLSYTRIVDYNMVITYIAQLTASFEYLKWLGMGMELLAILLAIIAIGSLHSVNGKSLHVAVVAGTVAMFSLGLIAKLFYNSAIDAAWSQLPGMFSAETIRNALYVKEQLRINYGFWDGAADVVNTIFSYGSLAIFVGALATSKVSTIWQPTPTDLSRPLAPAPEEKPVIEPTTVAPGSPMKFCRHCGAEIPRVSKFCEECGAELA